MICPGADTRLPAHGRAVASDPLKGNVDDG
jgi:hypothetical protein